MRSICLLLLLLTTTLTATPPLRVGMELTYPPFETVSQNGEPCGISIDIARALGKFLDRNIEVQNMSFIGLIPALKTGKVDAVISSISKTDLRNKVIDFSDPYATVPLALLISTKSTVKDIGEADQPGRIVVVKSGTSGEIYARQHLKQATVRIFDQQSTCVLEVVQGKADAFIYDQLSVYSHWQRHKETTRANLNPITTEYWCVGIGKGNKALLDKVNAFIVQFRAEGGFDKLAEEYLPEQKAAFKKLNLHFIF